MNSPNFLMFFFFCSMDINRDRMWFFFVVFFVIKYFLRCFELSFVDSDFLLLLLYLLQGFHFITLSNRVRTFSVQILHLLINHKRWSLSIHYGCRYISSWVNRCVYWRPLSALRSNVNESNEDMQISIEENNFDLMSLICLLRFQAENLIHFQNMFSHQLFRVLVVCTR